MTLEQRAGALEAQIEAFSQRLTALERRLDHQAANEELHRRKLRGVEEALAALAAHAPVDSATREVMWRRIEALEGTSGEEAPPGIARILRRLAVLEERIR